ncbi:MULTISPECIES: hypothetical protein [Burkholderia]|uniref:hypothetical protein n=1 Tax=Burkholderia TaxID=32008 RepID=UPI001269C0F0|nr:MULTISPECIES: hypothetical protein [Burkholderia]
MNARSAHRQAGIAPEPLCAWRYPLRSTSCACPSSAFVFQYLFSGQNPGRVSSPEVNYAAHCNTGRIAEMKRVLRDSHIEPVVQWRQRCNVSADLRQLAIVNPIQSGYAKESAHFIFLKHGTGEFAGSAGRCLPDSSPPIVHFGETANHVLTD